MAREYWINIFTDDDRCIRHASREDALDELIERARNRGEDRVTDYECTLCVVRDEGRTRAIECFDTLDADADEELDRRDREACVAKYAPNWVE